MRILHIDKFYPPTSGVGSYIGALAAAQRRRGNEVLQFGCDVQGDGSPMPEYVDFTARSPWKLPRMIHNPEAARRLQQFCRRHLIGVAHLHNIYHHLTPSILPVLARRGIGVVMTLHDYRLVCPTRHLLRLSGRCLKCIPNRFHHAAGPGCAGLGGVGLVVESYVQRFTRRYVRWIDAFICPTQYMRTLMIRAGIPSSKAVVVANPVTVLDVPAAPRQERAELLWIGRLEEGKAADMMLELAGALPDVRVRIVGDGPQAGWLGEQVARRGLANVDLHGAVPHGRLGEALARATAVVLTSRWMENSPQAMLEAMSAGRPVIVPDQPPLREWVDDGRTGRTFRDGDSDSLTRVASELLADAPGRKRMSSAACRRVRRRHDPDGVAERLERIYLRARERCALR